MGKRGRTERGIVPNSPLPSPFLTWEEGNHSQLNPCFISDSKLNTSACDYGTIHITKFFGWGLIDLRNSANNILFSKIKSHSKCFAS